MFAKLEQDPELVWQSMSEEYQRIVNWKHHSAQIEEPKIQMEIQAIQKMPAYYPLPNPRYRCSGLYFRMNSSFKNKK